MTSIDVQNALTDIKNSTSATNAAKAKANAGNSAIGQDAFLQLMMVQMQNQDPEKPMDSSQMLAQEAQFTQVSELQKINSALSGANNIAQASALIGKEITATDPNDSSKIISGTVTEASFGTDGTSLIIDDNNTTIPMKLLLTVKDAKPTTTTQ